jgi:streptogramin lyase
MAESVVGRATSEGEEATIGMRAACASVRGRGVVGAFAVGLSLLVAPVCAQGAMRPARAFSTFPLPTAQGFPGGITAGPDGNVWFTENGSGKIGRITPGGTINEFRIPTPGSSPDGITAGPDGNLWFTEGVGNKIGRITPSGTISEFPIPTVGSAPAGIASGPAGDVWFTEASGNNIGRITPSGRISEFPVLTEESSPQAITAGPHGTVWFTEVYGNQIVRVEPRLLEQCKVPQLRGKTLAQAKQVLGRGHCKLGQVIQPAKHRRKLVVVEQKPAAKKALPAGTKVGLRLG